MDSYRKQLECLRYLGCDQFPVSSAFLSRRASGSTSMLFNHRNMRSRFSSSLLGLGSPSNGPKRELTHETMRNHCNFMHFVLFSPDESFDAKNTRDSRRSSP